MSIHPEDPRLTAWLLGELSAEDAAAVERTVAADPALQLAVRDMEKLQRLLVDTLAPGSAALLPRQRDAVLRAARQTDQQARAGSTTRFTAARKPIPWLFPLAAAAVLALAALMLLRLPTNPASRTAHNPDAPPPTDASLPIEVALLPAPAPPAVGIVNDSAAVRPAASANWSQAVDARSRALDEQGDLFLRKVAERLAENPPPAADRLPPLVRRGAVSALDHPEMQLPVHAGRASLAWITRSIRGEKSQPARDAVRLEEILNIFPLRPAGPAAVSRGVTLSTETIACPWKPSAVLLLVTFRGAAEGTREVAATFKANPSSVRSYRLLGFANVHGVPTAPLPQRLPASSITSLVIEIDPATPSPHLGTIDWKVAGQSAPTVTLERRSDAEPSDDARFAALVCTFAQWLTGERSGMIDSDLLAALARESNSATLPADRVDFLNLVDQALRLHW